MHPPRGFLPQLALRQACPFKNRLKAMPAPDAIAPANAFLPPLSTFHLQPALTNAE